MSEPTEQQLIELLRDANCIECWMPKGPRRRILSIEARKAIVALLSAAAPRQAEWQPGDRRCVECDSGLEPEWVYCPFCAKLSGRLSGDEEQKS